MVFKKPALKEKNALMNLPYVIDGETVITQSNACLTYLGRKFNLNGKDDQELNRVEQCICEVFDLRNNAVGLFYSPQDQFDAKRDNFIDNQVATSYGKLDGFMSQNGTTFLASNSPTTPDFHFFELIDQIEELAKKYNKDSPMKKFANVEKLYETFKALPAIAKYLESDLHKLPINNKMAAFGN